MRRHLLIAAGLLALLSPAKAADSPVANYPAASAFGGTELLYVAQGGTDRKGTPLQMAAYVYGLMSGDATTTGPGVFTLATVNGNVGSFGSTTQCAAVTVNAKGLITAISAATCAPAVGSVTGLGTGVATFLATPSSANLLAALTTKTGTGNAVFGTAPTIDSLNATTALTLAFITGSTQCLHVNTSGVLSGTGSDCGSGGSTTITAGTTVTSGITSGHFLGSSSNLVVDQTAVTSIATSCGATGGTITTTGTISASISTNLQSGTNYAIVTGDCGKLVNLSNAANQIPTIAQAGTAGFAAGYFATICNIGAGTQTITPATSTIGGAATYVLRAANAASPVCVGIVSDGTNYQITPESGLGTVSGAVKASSGQLSQAACADLSNGTALCSTTPGTGVAAAAAVTLSAAGGLTSTIASGTSAMGTSAIASAACATVVTTSATNTATTDVVLASFNGDPTAVTGYIPATAGMLTIIGYPTANNVNFKVCNNTTSSITPGAITLNWRVLR